MSSYKTDATTQEPVHYLKNTKTELWKKFQENYPDGIKRTTFYKYLQGNRYIYHENLGSLYLICNTYSYETFDELTKFIQHHISNLHIQVIFSIIFVKKNYFLLIIFFLESTNRSRKKITTIF